LLTSNITRWNACPGGAATARCGDLRGGYTASAGSPSCAFCSVDYEPWNWTTGINEWRCPPLIGDINVPTVGLCSASNTTLDAPSVLLSSNVASSSRLQPSNWTRGSAFLAPGSHTLRFSIANIGDSGFSSYLLVDNVELRSEGLSMTPSITPSSTGTPSFTNTGTPTPISSPVFSLSGDAVDGLLGYTVSGAPLFVVDRCGNVDAAMFIPLNTYITSPSVASLPVGNAPRTVTAWVMLGPSIYTYTNYFFLYGGGAPWPCVSQFGISVAPPSGTRGVYLASLCNDFQTSQVFPTTGWAHLAVSWNGASVMIYINGSLASGSRLGSSQPLNTAATPIYLGWNGGSNTTSGGHVFTGTIDDVRLYSSALSSAAIAYLYAQTCVAPATPSSTKTGTPSNTQTATPSNTQTGTSTSSQTGTFTSSQTGTSTSSQTGTSTSSQTGSAMSSLTITPSSTQTGTASLTRSPPFLPSQTRTTSPTSTFTPSTTPLPSNFVFQNRYGFETNSSGFNNVSTYFGFQSCALAPWVASNSSAVAVVPSALNYRGDTILPRTGNCMAKITAGNVNVQNAISLPLYTLTRMNFSFDYQFVSMDESSSTGTIG